MARENWWTNSDGLYVGYGTRDVSTTLAGKTSKGGLKQELTVRIVGTDLADAATVDQLAHSAVIPAGAFIESATLEVHTAFAGSNAVLDIGVYAVDSDGTTDDDGIDAAVAVTSIDAEQDTIACDGAVVDTVLDAPYGVGASYDTAAFTAGVGTLTIVYYIPQP